MRIKFYFLVLLLPFTAKAFQDNNKVASKELATRLNVIKNIAPNNVDSLVNYADEVGKYYQNFNQTKELSSIKQATGAVLLRYGYFCLAEKYYLESILLNQKYKDRKNEADNTNSLGVVWGKRGDFVKAESFFLRALLIASQNNYTNGIISSFFKLSTLRIRQNKPNECLKFCSKADSVNQQYNTHFLEIDITSNKAVVYAMQGNLDKALKLFNQAYSFAIINKKAVEQVLCLQNIGLVYKEKDDLVKATDYIDRGLALARKNGLKDEELRLAINIPSILVDKKQYELAETKLSELLVQAKNQHLDDLVLEIYKNLTDIAKTQNRYKDAFMYFNAYTKLKDKKANIQKERALQEAYVSLGLYKANAELIKKNQLLFKKDRERNILILIVVVITILLSFLVFILLRLRKLNGRLNQKRAQLTESNDIKNKLFSIIGHDLRGNQATTLGILKLINNDELDLNEKELYVSMLIKQSQSALTILDDLLLWGQAQIKGDKRENVAFEILPYVNAVFDLNAEAIRDKSLTVRNKDLDTMKVFTDNNHFSFIIRNLVANAIKFTPRGGKILVYMEQYTKDLVKICVADSGVGMNSEELIAVFSPRNMSKKGTDNETGTGLGLILCREFVEANGGKIWAEHNSNGGTTFCFTCKKG